MKDDRKPGLTQMRGDSGFRFITGRQLKRMNAESIQIGMSRNFYEDFLERHCDDADAYPIKASFYHRSTLDDPPLESVRLILEINGKNAVLDVTNDAWAELQQES